MSVNFAYVYLGRESSYTFIYLPKISKKLTSIPIYNMAVLLGLLTFIKKYRESRRNKLCYEYIVLVINILK